MPPYDRNAPNFIKYMGSKSSLLDEVMAGINAVYGDERQVRTVCDLFSGSGTLSGALRNSVPMISNDIQEYSRVLSLSYLKSYQWDEYPEDILERIVDRATEVHNDFRASFPDYQFDYIDGMEMPQVQELEALQQDLLTHDFRNHPYHLFVKNFSGTYWAYDQCVWIDSFRAVADEYHGTPLYNLILSSLMFAMAYNAQSTGHYAQYRDVQDEKNMNDILIYRRKEIVPMFSRKFHEAKQRLGVNNFDHQALAMDYRDCLAIIPHNSIVYADPPYQFVHYSRFYHCLETLVKYDYPDAEHKGRYRQDRHQSPFCIRTQVNAAFRSMFELIAASESDLVLSYSNTGMITLEDIQGMIEQAMGPTYQIEVDLVNYNHSTMGRREDKNREVQEAIIKVWR